MDCVDNRPRRRRGGGNTATKMTIGEPTVEMNVGLFHEGGVTMDPTEFVVGPFGTHKQIDAEHLIHRVGRIGGTMLNRHVDLSRRRTTRGKRRMMIGGSSTRRGLDDGKVAVIRVGTSVVAAGGVGVFDGPQIEVCKILDVHGGDTVVALSNDLGLLVVVEAAEGLEVSALQTVQEAGSDHDGSFDVCSFEGSGEN